MKFTKSLFLVSGAVATATVLALSQVGGMPGQLETILEGPRPQVAQLDDALDQALQASNELGGLRRQALPVQNYGAWVESVATLLRQERLPEVGTAIHDWLAGQEHMEQALAEILVRPITEPGDAVISGLLLQAALRYADQGASFMQGLTPAELADLAVECMDLGPLNSRTLYIGAGTMGALLPGSLLGDFAREMRGGKLTHMEVDAQLDRLKLLRAWAVDMGSDAEEVMLQLVNGEAETPNVRAAGVLGLMHRDWRRLGPELAATYTKAVEEGLDPNGAGFLLTANLAATDLNLNGRERLELLREVVKNEDVARYGLETLSPDQARDLLAYANEEDRSWPMFDWVRLVAAGPDVFDAGVQLLDHYRDHKNPAIAYDIFRRLTEVDANHSVLYAELERRFEARKSTRDPFWGMLEFSYSSLPESVRRHELPFWLSASAGDTHPGRQRLLDRLKSEYPAAVAGVR